MDLKELVWQNVRDRQTRMTRREFDAVWLAAQLATAGPQVRPLVEHVLTFELPPRSGQFR